jgi:hypothetical protein
MNVFLAAESWPFMFATGLMVMLGVVEVLSLLMGASASHWLDGIMPDVGGVEGFADTMLGWLHVGRAPLLALLVTFLTAFAVVGFGLQIAAGSIVGRFLPAWLAAIVAFAGALPVVRMFGGLLARILPKDETTAVSDASLVGRMATIVTGTARAGRPAEARLKDEYGKTHYVMVEPEEQGVQFERGASVLLVRQLRGRIFHAIRNPKPDLL